MKRSWFKNDDESVNDDGESVDGDAGVYGIDMGTLGGKDSLSSSKNFKLMRFQLQMQKWRCKGRSCKCRMRWR